MFNSAILDVIVGLVSVFLAISLIASALTEALASIIGMRARTLLAGIKLLVNDPNLNGLVYDLYNHALVNPLSNGTTKAGIMPNEKPSYIYSAHFALALIETLQKTAGAADTLDQAIEKISDAQIKEPLAALYRRAAGDINAFRVQVAQWFDSAMDRLSGTYKRWTKLITFCAALLAAALLNADPIHIADTLWQRPALARQLAKLKLPDTINATNPDQQALPIVKQIEGTGFVFGWNGFATDSRRHDAGLVLMLLGWLITAGAALFGAPFWFDILQRFVNVRGTGPSADVAASGNPSH